MVRRVEWKLVYDMEDGPKLYLLDEDPAHDDVLWKLYADLSSWTLRTRDTYSEKYPVMD